jgi:hypothetical protein
MKLTGTRRAMTTEGLCISVYSDLAQQLWVVARRHRAAIAPLSWLKLSWKQLDKSSKGENRNEIFPGSPLCAD